MAAETVAADTTGQTVRLAESAGYGGIADAPRSESGQGHGQETTAAAAAAAAEDSMFWLLEALPGPELELGPGRAPAFEREPAPEQTQFVEFVRMTETAAAALGVEKTGPEPEPAGVHHSAPLEEDLAMPDFWHSQAFGPQLLPNSESFSPTSQLERETQSA